MPVIRFPGHTKKSHYNRYCVVTLTDRPAAPIISHCNEFEVIQLNCYHAALPSEALLHISGPDTLAFLQGQTTCDTRLVDAGHAVPGVYCTPQGRVVCDFLLSRLGEEHYALRMRRDIMEHSAAVLGKYIIFSRAELDSGNRGWRVAACWGEDAATVVSSVFGAAPAGRFAVHCGDGFAVVQLDDRGRQFECQVACDRRGDLLQSLSEQCATGEETAWQTLQLQAGIARVESATVEEFVPQMLNYDVTGHISFTKGCYTGQEVVARLHYRGAPKRRLYLASWSGPAAAAGTLLYQTGANQGAGHVVNSVTSDNGALALVTSTRAGIEDGLHLGAADGPLLTTEATPYPLPELAAQVDT
jgi:folate-binding protein YgfZ